MLLMSRRPSWYDPSVETNPFVTALAEMRRVCNQAEHVMPYAKVPGSLALVEAIMAAIDDWAEHEMGARDFFYSRNHSAGCKHT